MSLKENLSDLVSFMRDQFLNWGDQLSQTEKDLVGEVDNWSVKDEIFHNMEWANRRLVMAETIERGEKWTDIDYGDYDEENRLVFEQYQHASWSDARDLIQSTYNSITEFVDRISDEILNSVPEGQENPLWQSIAGSYVLHPMFHYWGYLAKEGSLDRLVELFGKDFSERLISLNDAEKWQAVPHYNLACIYALTGNSKESIHHLRIALKHNPEFVDWSKQDPDLESIRSDPSYQELYNTKE